MNGERDTALAKFAKLEPKNPLDAQLAMSKVHISKSWKLPPRLKPGRRPALRSDSGKTNTVDPQPSTPLIEDIADEDIEEKKRRQNRDAQRAYRERRSNRIQELESTVESLQDLVRTWQRKCKSIELELAQEKKDLSYFKMENAALKRSLLEAQNASTTALYPGNSNTNGREHVEDGVLFGDSLSFLDPLLQNMINNFKPMKAVDLKKRKLPDYFPTATRTSSTANPSNSPGGESYSLPNNMPHSPVSTTKCGFCSDSTACVCQELEEENSSSRVVERCTQNTDTCNKCSNIDETCIKADLREKVKWKPGSCKQCKSDPQSRAFCQEVFSSNSSCCGKADPREGEAFKTCSGECANRKVTSTDSYVTDYTTKYATKKSAVDETSTFLDNDEQPNTMDPSFTPGSCAKCQSDPQSKAFCQAVFGSSTTSNSKEKGSCCGKGGCCSEGQPDNTEVCDANLHKSEGSQKEKVGNKNNPAALPSSSTNLKRKTEFIPISDAYKRVRKYMRIDEKDTSIKNASSLPLPMR